MVACRKCGAAFDDVEVKFCPQCGIPSPLSDEAAAARGDAPYSSANPVSNRWLWLIGVPVVVIGVIMALAQSDRSKYPGKSSDRQMYEQCLSDLAAADRSRSGAGTVIAGVCERFRNDYIQKYGSTP
jgi:uncharacterized membrane protein YvbJ